MAFRSSEGRERSRLADWSAAMLVQKRNKKSKIFPVESWDEVKKRESVCFYTNRER